MSSLDTLHHPGKPTPARRRTDRDQLLDQRFLDWGSRDSDIELLPHSPLALAKVLANPEGGRLVLQARHVSEAAVGERAEGDGRREPTGNARLGETARETARANLLTAHDADTLAQRCKLIQIENALVKQQGLRQLYFVAGFLRFEGSNEHLCAPLLLYPMLLARNPENRACELRLDGGPPEQNRELLALLKQQYGLTVPGLADDTPLSDYFADVADALRSSTQWQLSFDCALGNAASISGQDTGSTSLGIPRIPEHFDPALALSLTGNQTLGQLNAVLKLIPDYQQLIPDHQRHEPTTAARQPSLPRSTNVAGLREYAARLAAEGLDHIAFRRLPELPQRMERWSSALSRCLRSPLLNQTLARPNMSVREMIRLSTLGELIDKAPQDIEQYAHGDLAFRANATLCQRAQHQAGLIAEETDALRPVFDVDRVPSLEQLLSLINELEGSYGASIDIVNEHYFHARRQFADFCIEKPGELDEQHRDELRQLARLLRFRELFVNNTEYRQALGPGYKGMHTDWAALERNLAYAQELAQVLGSQELAAHILEHWNAFRSNYVDELDMLLESAEAARRLLATIGSRWQSQSLSVVIAHARVTASRLGEWEQIYGPAHSHADKTAATVLSSFTGRSRDDVLVETHVNEMQTRIQRQLLDGTLGREQVTATIGWLRAASDAARKGELGMEELVECFASPSLPPVLESNTASGAAHSPPSRGCRSMN
ncbi:MAG: hypothetical protein CSB44_04445 [Gammaproteobacteria bacterium]|nr:MAG: hypothetical protein CSB44_04445 [Gammaproteobacteria bacterium]